MKKTILLMAMGLLMCFVGLDSCQHNGIRLYTQHPFERLSDYGFFEGALHKLQAADGLLPYDLNSALFSDYAHKQRFVYVPPSSTIPFQDSAVLDFPVGSVLIKNFYYPSDTLADYPKRLIETRLLVHRPSGWEALPYVWNTDQSDAILEITGGIKTIKSNPSAGIQHDFEYIIPNKNQCKGCHNHAGVLLPIGPKIRNLNKDYSYVSGRHNQLDYWQAQAWFRDSLPSNLAKTVDWKDSTASLHLRALAYLDINCAHCHQQAGPASTAGLDLSYDQSSQANLGIWKSPVATGKGTGGRAYSIVPGHPEQSILPFRMQSTDPGAMMPELGRTLIHHQGVQLIRDWIAQMDSLPPS